MADLKFLSVTHDFLLDQDLLRGSKQSFFISCLLLAVQFQKLGTSCCLDLIRDLVFHRCRLRSFSSGIFENMGLIEIYFIYKCL